MIQPLKDLRYAWSMRSGTISNYRLIRSNRGVMRKLREAEQAPHANKAEDDDGEVSSR